MQQPGARRGAALRVPPHGGAGVRRAAVLRCSRLRRADPARLGRAVHANDVVPLPALSPGALLFGAAPARPLLPPLPHRCHVPGQRHHADLHLRLHLVAVRRQHAAAPAIHIGNQQRSGRDSLPPPHVQ